MASRGLALAAGRAAAVALYSYAVAAARRGVDKDAGPVSVELLLVLRSSDQCRTGNGSGETTVAGGGDGTPSLGLSTYLRTNMKAARCVQTEKQRSQQKLASGEREEKVGRETSRIQLVEAP